MAIAVALLSLVAFERNSVWMTHLSFWTDVARKTPQKSRVHNSLGNSYMLLGKNFEAVQEYKIALALDKNNIEAYYNLAVNLERVGLEEEAAYYYNYFCTAAPADYQEAVQKSCKRARELSSARGAPAP